VKTGSGAFMRETKDAIELAKSLISTAKAFNKKVIAFITDMNQPLGNYIGNWLEVYESIKVLRGEQKSELLDLSLNLSGAMIYLGGKAGSIKEGATIAKEQINNGKAFEKFVQMIELQGGKTKFILQPEKYPKSKFITKLKSTKNGYAKEINTYQIGMAALELGAGRKTKTDKIDPKAGIVFKVKLGDKINKGDVIAELHAHSMDKINTAKGLILGAITVSKQKTIRPKLIKKIIK
jgi:thymidine phosphorylase